MIQIPVLDTEGEDSGAHSENRHWWIRRMEGHAKRHTHQAVGCVHDYGNYAIWHPAYLASHCVLIRTHSYDLITSSCLQLFSFLGRIWTRKPRNLLALVTHCRNLSLGRVRGRRVWLSVGNLSNNTRQHQPCLYHRPLSYA